LALFNFSKKPATPAAAEDAPIQYSPEKAKRFFEHAKTVHEATNFEYAVQSWLSGLRQDPGSMEGLTGFFASISKFLGETEGKRGVSKEVIKGVSGKSELDKYLLSLLEWGQKPNDAALAIRAFENASRLGLKDPTVWIGERAMGWAQRDKPRKEHFVKLADGFEKVGAFDRAVVAAESASKLDPADGDLGARVRQLAASATMKRGGFDDAGQEGGFRSNIRDQSKQRHLEEADRIVKTESTVERLLAAAEQDLQSRPADLPTIERLGKLLLERGRPEDEERAHALYLRAHKDSNQFRFRELAGDLRLRQARRRFTAAKAALDAGDMSKAGEVEDSLRDLLKLEIEEWQLRVAAYPTDLVKKFELGKRLYANDQFEDSIPMFQEAQGEPRYRAASLTYLAQAFLKLDWLTESIETFRRALELPDLLPEQQMDIQYGLLVALQAKGEGERDLPAAEEAEKLASAIAIKQLTFKDIRARRESLKKLVQSIRGASA
jgi:tetratricopeptide (TPR) repeat protein